MPISVHALLKLPCCCLPRQTKKGSDLDVSGRYSLLNLSIDLVLVGLDCNYYCLADLRAVRDVSPRFDGVDTGDAGYQQ